MSAHLERAWILYRQGRWEEAEKEIRAALVLDPNDPVAHALAALCLGETERFDAATDEAQQAIALAPDVAFTHYVLARVMQKRNRFAEARQANIEAVRLDPDNADYVAQRSVIEFETRRWQAALDAAEQGLRIDPEHVDCTNLRVRALAQLGRKLEADQAVQTALRKAPDDAVTHANRGWTLLEQGDPANAMTHFREALRLDPNLDWARAGIVEALKSRHFIYRWMLGYFFWMSRLSGGAQWAVIVGAFLLYRAVSNVNAQHPELALITRPLLIAYLVFFALSWLARPVFNSLLRLNRFGRLALSREDVVQSNLVCLFLVPALIGGVVYGVTGESVAGMFGIVIGATGGFAAILIANVFNCSDGWPRRAMIAGSVVYLAASAAALVMFTRAYAGQGQFHVQRLDSALKWHSGVVMPLAFILLIAGNILASTRPKR